MVTNYDGSFYDAIKDGCVSSAKKVAPIVFNYFKPKTVVDIGCGQGHWAKEFENLGCDVLGVDGDYVTDPVVNFLPHNLENPIPEIGNFDLAISLEVAEHLREPSSDRFIRDLTNLAPIVLFSAAIPGQGGVDHFNEQWPSYWAQKFLECGYDVTGALRFEIWNDDDIENWYRQNLLVAVSNDAPKPKKLFSHPLSDPISVVHPVLWNSRL